MTTSRPRQAPARPTRRPRGAPIQRRGDSFLQRNRTRLLWAGGLAALVVVGGIAYLNLTAPAYACTQIWAPTPAPAATPGPDGTPATSLPFYVQPDLGDGHVGSSAAVNYLYCPPASGRHYSGPGIGPIRPDAYGPEERALPQGWIHNLEHGGIVLLYRCPGEACEPAGQAALEQLYREFPDSPVCSIPARSAGGSPVIARFDEMAWPYAAVLWGMVLPLETLDRDAILDFYAANGERFNPEPFCPRPTPTPGPAATPGPTSSPDSSPDAESPAPSPS